MSLSTDQHRAILDKIIETEDLKLKKYDVNQRHLSGVPADIIMTAAVKLEMTSIYGSLKCSESFKFIAESPIMNLKRLKTHWSISSITIGTPPDAPPDVLAAAAVRVEDSR